jgi:membrane protease YdiL (CAAX protease family)
MDTISQNTSNGARHKFITLWFLGIVGAAAVLPYAFTLQKDIIEKVGQPLWVLVLASIAQTAVLLAIAVFLGLKLARSLNLSVLDFPLKEKTSTFFKTTVLWGIVTGVLIVLGDKIFGIYIPKLSVVNSQVAVWKTLLASLYGGIVEEILLRLLVMSLFAWLLSKIFRVAQAKNNVWVMWSAIIISSVLFGLGHLPITSALTAITPLVVVRAIVLNGIGGVVFGWLFWKKGLEYAMVAHFTADIILLSVLPLLLK